MFPLQLKEKTFSSGNPWPNGISQAERTVHKVNHSLAQCGLKCLTAISCQAFTYEEDNHPICSLHDKLLEIDHNHPVSKPTAKYFQRVSFKLCYFLSLHTWTCSSSIILDVQSKKWVNSWSRCLLRHYSSVVARERAIYKLKGGLLNFSIRPWWAVDVIYKETLLFPRNR